MWREEDLVGSEGGRKLIPPGLFSATLALTAARSGLTPALGGRQIPTVQEYGELNVQKVQYQTQSWRQVVKEGVT